MMEAVIAKYKPRLQGKTVMLYVGGLRPRHVIGAYEDLGMKVIGTGYEFAHNDDYDRTIKEMGNATLLYDDATGFELEEFIKRIKPDLVGSGIKEKYVFQKMGIPLRQMHSWDYSGPYHGYDGFAIFARDMDMAISNPCWSKQTPPWKKLPEAAETTRAEEGRLNEPFPSTCACVHKWVAQAKEMKMQTVDDIKPCYPLFREEDYKVSLKNKQDLFEERHSPEKVQEVFLWTTTQEYQELNFKREALTVNPAKACQPLGAVLCALGFEKTLPYVHGSQGCVVLFPHLFQPSFQGADLLRLGLDDRGRRRLRRPEEHVRWPGKRHGDLQAGR
jgi:nitrogenase molybdenum-iron protein alpha/beta subunit